MKYRNNGKMLFTSLLILKYINNIHDMALLIDVWMPKKMYMISVPFLLALIRFSE